MSARKLNLVRPGTKERILAAASHHFALSGYEGASIRDIARDAEVNLAAVNYHFKSKHGLYWETFVQAHTWLEQSIVAIDDYDTTEELAKKILELFLKNGDYLRNTFRTITSASAPAPEGEHLAFCRDKKIGPPGSDTLAAAIHKDCGPEVANAGVVWAVRSIFSYILHTAMMVGAPYLQHIGDFRHTLTQTNIEQQLTLQVRAVLNLLRAQDDFPDY